MIGYLVQQYVTWYNSVEVPVCDWSLRQPRNRLNYLSVMHLSFVTTAPIGPGNSGDIDLSLCKARVYAQHCRNIFYDQSPAQILAGKCEITSAVCQTGHENQKPHARGSTALLGRC